MAEAEKEKNMISTASTINTKSTTDVANVKTPEKKLNYANFNPGPIKLATSVPGVFLDFNYGVRIQVPKGNYHVRFIDKDTSTILYDADISGAMATSTKKYYVNFRVELYKDGYLIFAHDLDLKNKPVHIKYPVGTLGDIMAWFPYAREFQKKHGCQVYCSMSEEIAGLFKPAYPDIKFIKPETVPDNCYATYYMGIFFPANDRNHQPVDFRIVGLQKNIAYLLGLDALEHRPILTPSKKEPEVKEPYVCIAAQATSQAKYWNNPAGWIETVAYLKSLGYRVLCIDKEKCHGIGRHWNTIPYGVDDFTGSRPLQDRVNMLSHADFFIGLSSGLSWLAWGAGIPVIMISGFSLPVNEFYTPYRIINYHVCNGCWTDSSEEFVHSDFAWCPRHQNTPREFECSRFISAGQVIQNIDRLMKDYHLDPKARLAAIKHDNKKSATFVAEKRKHIKGGKK
jgi:autotransporter strand-loop-strand O-heptosyltransferase